MKKITRYLLLFLGFSTFFSCNSPQTNADKIFATIGLNSNKVPSSFQQSFNEILNHKKIGNLKVFSESKKEYVPASAQEFIAYRYKNIFDEDIRKVKELPADEESQPIIDAGLRMFQYAEEIYKDDYPKIARMIDEGASDEEINAVVTQLDATKGIELDRLRAKAMELLLPYADKHGVEYKTIN